MNRSYHSNIPLSLSKNYHLRVKAGVVTFRAYLPVENYGTCHYRIWEQNAVDSTWEYGDYSTSNLKGSRYRIVSASLGVSADDSTIMRTVPLTFDGEQTRMVLPGECYESDAVTFTVHPGEKLVITQAIEVFDAENILPTTPDSQALSFMAYGDCAADADSSRMQTAEQLMLPSLIVCDKPDVQNLTVWGDSITQGCGTEVNKAQMWAARLSEQVKDRYAIWNIGLGFGHGEDAATCGAWMNKALLLDGPIQIAFGVNDILTGRKTAEEILSYYRTLIDTIHKANPDRRIVLCTIPTFDFEGNDQKVWREVLAFVRGGGFPEVDVFDFAAVVSDEKDDHIAKYGPHPDAVGGQVLADKMAQFYLK